MPTSPFVVAPSLSSLPKEIRDLVDERFKHDFLLVLDPSKKEEDNLAVSSFGRPGQRMTVDAMALLRMALPRPHRHLQLTVTFYDPQLTEAFFAFFLRTTFESST